ncbi:hypothetical protein, partial [Geobacillus sp. AYS3]|uniref:hypothetical protein n=1 Tax=Geobacillus sp. AYS3 TaxID=2603623 RepID=UPI001C9D28DE
DKERRKYSAHFMMWLNSYFIEALKVYSDQKGLEEDMKFYHAQKISTSSSVIRDVTNQLEEVFQLLTEPFHQLEEETLQDDEDR